MKKIIFVCTGGTCRSPMAEHLLKHKLKQAGILPKQYAVSSAGIMANLVEHINPNTVAVLKENGINVRLNTKARQLNKKMVTNSTTLIAINPEHKDWIRNLPNVYCLSDFIPEMIVPDPFGLDITYYRLTYDMLNKATDVLLQLIQTNKL